MGPVEVELIGGATGVRVALQNAVFLLIEGSRGYLMCGYLNCETAERKGDIAAMVSGVSTFEDMLSAKVSWVSSGGKAIGIREGMSGKDALSLMS